MTQTTILYGVHATTHGLQNPNRKGGNLWTTTNVQKRIGQDLKKWVYKSKHKINVFTVDRGFLDKKLGNDCVHQGIAYETNIIEPRDIADIDNGFYVALDQITDPHNVGAMIRSCVAFGVDGIITTSRHNAPQTGVMAKSACGGLEYIKLYETTNLSRGLEDLQSRGFTVVGFSGHGNVPLEDVKHDGKTIVIMGAEGKGMRQLTEKKCDIVTKIPTCGKLQDLNVSNATAVALFHFLG